MRKAVGLLSLLALLVPLAPLHAQSLITVSPQQCVWHAGDNPAWAAPSFDDSAWQPYTRWSLQPDQAHLWVRCHADLSALRGLSQPALQVRFLPAYTLFLDGRLIGVRGNPRSGAYDMDSIHTFPVAPAGLVPTPSVVAIRIVYRVQRESDPLSLLAGEAQLLREHRNSIAYTQANRLLPVEVCFLVIGVIGLVLAGLYLNDRSRTEFLMLALVCEALLILRTEEYCLSALYPLGFTVNGFLNGLASLDTIPYLLFIFRIARRRMPWFYRIVLVASSYLFTQALFLFFSPVASLRADFLFVRTLQFAVLLAVASVSASFVAFWPWNRIPKHLRAVAVCCALWSVADVSWFIAFLIGNSDFTGAAGVAFLQRWGPSLLVARAVGTLSVILVLVVLLFRDQRRTAEERALLAGEMQAAREMQSSLVPASMVAIPGLRLEAAFLPMSEVGGDFYQVLPEPDGSTLILLGDVSGKGLRAAMIGTQIVGGFQALGRQCLSPAEILLALNDQLTASSDSGFATCLCARIAPHGDVHLANAGHLTPWRNGVEVELSGSLPLGMTDALDPALLTFALAPGDTLTFLSDGVVEARNAEGELFGFDRARAISTRSAEQIAQAAQAFGQSDDITVLTLQFAPAEVLHA
jgi:phosphoserine phosphatase RsbU/P